jgi:DtxR family Mn-dependent transcriptional regulator
MNARTSPAAEDYLKVIYTITRASERASTNDIAQLMAVTPASATGMVQKLAGEKPPLLLYEKHRGVSLTLEGEHLALEIIRHHRLLETFLQEKLGYTWDEVHDEADRLEHVISEELEDRIARVLGDPHYDPHGDPIPNREFTLPDQSNTSLSELHIGNRATVVRISTDDPALLRYLSSIGLSLQSRITVTDVSPFDGNTVLEIEENDKSCILGPRITDKIFVEVIPTRTYSPQNISHQ